MVAGAGQTPPEILPQARVLHRIQCNLEVQDCIHNLTLLWCAWSTCFWLPRHLQRVTDRIWTGYHLAIDCNNDPCPMPSWFPCLLLATTSYTVGANTTDFQAWKAAISAWLQQHLLKALTPVQCWCNIACALLYSWRLYHPISHLLLCLCVHLRLERTRRPQAGHRIRQVQEAQQAEPPRAVTSPQARPARRAATGLRPDQLGRGQDRPYVQGRQENTTARGLQEGKETSKRRKERRGDDRKPTMCDIGLGRRAAGEASEGLEIEGANKAQPVGSLAERTNWLVEIEIRKGPTNYTMCCKKYWLACSGRAKGERVTDQSRASCWRWRTITVAGSLRESRTVTRDRSRPTQLALPCVLQGWPCWNATCTGVPAHLGVDSSSPRHWFSHSMV